MVLRLLRRRPRWLGVVLTFFLLALLPRPLLAQVLDPTFRPIEARAAPTNTINGAVRALAYDQTGGTLVGGAFQYFNGIARGGLIRLLSSGQPDPAFDPGGSGTDGAVYAIKSLRNGKVVIAGDFTYYDGTRAGRVVQLNPDGTPDPSFGTGGIGADGAIYALEVDAQNRIVLGGDFHHFNGVPAAGGVVRLLPNGRLDPSFSFPINGGVVYSLAVDGNKVYAGGAFNAGAGTLRFLYRLLASGVPDTTFNRYGSGPDNVVNCIRVVGAGKLLIGGAFTSYNNQGTQYLAQLLPNGSVDSRFSHGLQGYFGAGMVQTLQVLQNGDIMVAGVNLVLSQTTNRFQSVWVLSSSGSTFTNYTAPNLRLPVYALLPAFSGGSLLVGGLFRPTSAATPLRWLVRLTASGSRDASFAEPVLQQMAHTRQLLTQTDDRLVALGNFGHLNGQVSGPIARFMPDGAVDSTFRCDTLLAARYLALQPNNQVIVTTSDHVLRLRPDGALDTTFRDGSGADTAIFSNGITGATVQPDGKVLVSGDFDRYAGVVRWGLVRLMPNGAVDPTFVPPVNAGSAFFPLPPQLLPDGSMVVLEKLDSGPEMRLRWLDASGTPLASFNGGAPVEYVTNCLPLPDTTLLLSGAFTLSNFHGYQGTWKVGPTEAVDSTFVLDSLAEASGAPLFRQANGQLLWFESDGLLTRLRWLLPNGQADGSFAPVEITRVPSWEQPCQLAQQSTGNLILSGPFSRVGGQRRPFLVRLLNLPNGLPAAPGKPYPADLYPNPTHDRLTLRRPVAESATATLLDVLGRPVRRWALTGAEETVSVVGVPVGAYVLRVVGATGVLTRRVVVE